MEPKGPFCQSCAMPMEKPEMFGTLSHGSKSQQYCTYCFQEGAFTEPDISMQEMIDKCVAIMDQQNIMPKDQAQDLMAETIPFLKRWKRA
ncbi:MAG: zinc ribbon domain-containing protein [Thermodesulfobacteriota bacterium]|nr:zinc ribbon domain-containing protein [Thermodesulfobacteriota bacterium]